MVLQWKSLCFTGAIQLDINAFEHCIQVTGNIGIPEADNAISFLFQPSLPFAIAFGCCVVIVMSAVHFNDQMLCWTEEVHNVGSDRRLTSEMGTFYRQLFQSAP